MVGPVEHPVYDRDGVARAVGGENLSEQKIASTEDDDPQPESALSSRAIHRPNARGQQEPDQAAEHTADPPHRGIAQRGEAKAGKEYQGHPRPNRHSEAVHQKSPDHRLRFVTGPEPGVASLNYNSPLSPTVFKQRNLPLLFHNS